VNLQFRTGPKEVIKDLASMMTNSQMAHEYAQTMQLLFAWKNQRKYWRFNLCKDSSGHDVAQRLIEEKDFLSWFRQSPNRVNKEYRYEDVMMLMDDWQAIPVIRRLTDLWLDRETKSLDECAKALGSVGKV
jgi:hypothetical protein